MKTKQCIICENEFHFKNKLKTTCSNKCRQQLSRNRKKEQETTLKASTVNSDYYKSELNGIIQELYYTSIDRILSFCKNQPIHISELQFLDNISDILTFYSAQEKQFSAFHELLNKMNRVAYEGADKNGYLIFKTKKVKPILKKLQQILEETF